MADIDRGGPPVLKLSRLADFFGQVKERTDTGFISISEAADLLIDGMTFDDVIRVRDAAINLQQFCEIRLVARTKG